MSYQNFVVISLLLKEDTRVFGIRSDIIVRNVSIVKSVNDAHQLCITMARTQDYVNDHARKTWQSVYDRMATRSIATRSTK